MYERPPLLIILPEFPGQPRLSFIHPYFLSSLSLLTRKETNQFDKTKKKRNKKTAHATLRQHNRAVFSAQAIHHVSRQIEGLYWQQVKDQNAHKGVDEFDALAGDDDGSVRRNVFVRGSDYSNET